MINNQIDEHLKNQENFCLICIYASSFVSHWNVCSTFRLSEQIYLFNWSIFYLTSEHKCHKVAHAITKFISTNEMDEGKKKLNVGKIDLEFSNNLSIMRSTRNEINRLLLLVSLQCFVSCFCFILDLQLLIVYVTLSNHIYRYVYIRQVCRVYISLYLFISLTVYSL